MQSYFIVGGAGFIGSHMVDFLISDPKTSKITVYDNFSSGKFWHLENHNNNSKLEMVAGEIADKDFLIENMQNHNTVIHLASNPDIAKSQSEPTIDFTEGTVLTNSILEAMRINNIKRILYASGSGIYGDLGLQEIHEDHGPLLPISTYGASKLAGEALIHSYCYMFDISACVFRFGNVVGRRQTHGVGFDFVRQLLKHPDYLNVLGNGTQSKSYIHVSDVISAVFTAHQQVPKYQAFNVATGDYITVKEIAELVIECMNLKNVKINFTNEDRGWKADIPVCRLNTDRIKHLGWSCKNPTREALKLSIMDMLNDLKNGKDQ